MVKNKVHGQTSSSPMYPGLWECRSRPRDWMSAKSMAGIISPLSVINIKIWLDTDFVLLLKTKADADPEVSYNS